MSIIKLGPDNFERFTVIARPRRYFSLSSTGQVIGSVPVFPRLSTIEKDVVSNSSLDAAPYADSGTTLAAYSDLFQSRSVPPDYAAYFTSSLEVSAAFDRYVNTFTTNAERSKKMEVTRFVPPFTFDNVMDPEITVNQEVLKKSAIQNNLFRFYRPKNSYADWSFTNYQCLNFFSSPTTLTSSALIYRNTSFDPGDVWSGQFSFEFFINPRYKPHVNEEFKAGTIIQISGSNTVSLITGSHRDSEGRVDKFKLQFQLGSTAANLPPSTATGANVFVSDDNVLSYNKWHHVVVRWSSSNKRGYVSFVVDGNEYGRFDTSSSPVFNSTNNIVLGNFYEGTQLISLATFFNNDYSGAWAHPLRSEIHEIKLWNKYLSDDEIKHYQSNSVGSMLPDGLSFYVPVLFTIQSYYVPPSTSYVPQILNDLGTAKVNLNRDFLTARAGSSPYNSLLHFNSNEIEVNLENYTRDFANGVYPRLYNLTGSANTVPGTSLYNQPKFRKRNLTVLPCDNGRLQMDYSILASGTLEQKPPITGSAHSRFVNDFGSLDLSLVSLRNVIPSSSFPFSDTSPPTTYTDTRGVPLPTRYARTADNSSDAVVFFESSNLFYGSRIHPGSLTLVDPNLSQSDGEISITLKDNGFGGLYRADALTPHATWAGVGTVLYDEGITVIKSPMLAHFGISSFSMEMRGERPVHVMQIAVPCPAGQVNSSSNPTFQPLTASDVPSETSVGPVIITGINFHDDNLNVVARSQLAQPIIKRNEDRFLFRTKIDW